MYKLISAIGLGLLLGTAVQAQLTLSLHEPPAGVVQQSQLWNLVLAYGGNQSISVTIGLSLFDVKDNQPVMTALTPPVIINKGVRQLKASDVAPVGYSYLSPTFNINRQSGGFIPVGQYRACYTVYAGMKEATSVLAEDCINLEVVPLMPPQLVLPADSGTVETAYPQFSWLPPAPVTLFSDLNYDMIIAEVRPGQTPQSAIQENLPVYNGYRLTNAAFSYPASYKRIDTGKNYAWRIVAKNGDQFAAQSEVFTFRRAQNQLAAPVPANGMYLGLTNNNGYTGTALLPDNVLGIKYYSYDKTHDATIRMVDQKGALIQEYKRTIAYGNNFLAFRLGNGFSPGTIYFIELSDLEQVRYSASFQLSK
jgi:hypothetical protein